MKKEWEPRQSRVTTHFKFYSEKYLWGSTRSELSPDERAVWIDFLCLASMNFGEIELYSRDQLAQQLLITRGLMDRSIEKFIKFGKIKKKFNKREKKEIFSIVNWSRYQADYLTKRLKKSTSYEEKKRIEKLEKDDAENPPTLQERRGEEKTLQEITLEKNIEEKSVELESPNSNPSIVSPPLLSNSTPSINQKGKTMKDEFLSLLKSCKGYPFNEIEDSLLFDITVKEYPRINILMQTEKKIEWWKDHTDALKPNANPREKLQDWFREESECQGRGGPQQLGAIMGGVDDPDQRNFLKGMIQDQTKKE